MKMSLLVMSRLNRCSVFDDFWFRDRWDSGEGMEGYVKRVEVMLQTKASVE